MSQPTARNLHQFPERRITDGVQPRVDQGTVATNLDLILTNYRETEANTNGVKALALGTVQSLVRDATNAQLMGLLQEMDFRSDQSDRSGMTYRHSDASANPVDFSLGISVNANDKTTFRTQLTTAIQAVLAANCAAWSSSPTGDDARALGVSMV